MLLAFIVIVLACFGIVMFALKQTGEVAATAAIKTSGVEFSFSAKEPTNKKTLDPADPFHNGGIIQP